MKPETVSVKVGDADAKPDPMVQKIQAGLKAFGNDGMEIDGVIGSKTRSAIREFQSLFGLPVTGEPDAKALCQDARDRPDELRAIGAEQKRVRMKRGDIVGISFGHRISGGRAASLVHCYLGHCEEE